MDELLRSRTAHFLANQGLLHPGTLILVAVSGGPDSLCLLHILASLAHTNALLLHVAHLDHGFRGAESAAEADMVAAIAAAWGFPATVSYCDVPTLARTMRRGNMDAARQARYTFLAQIARNEAAHALAVAHNADDQAETLLLHALRGAGPAGLRGMRPVVPWREWAAPSAEAPNAEPETGAVLIRPLLTTSRSEILTYCTTHGLQPANDPSNRSLHYARSRIRHHLLPLLSTYNPQLLSALGRTAQICAEDYDYIQLALESHWPSLVTSYPGRIDLHLQVWHNLHPALRRYALRRAASQLGVAEISFAHIETARTALDSGQPQALNMTHQLRLTIRSQHATLQSTSAPPIQASPQLADETLHLALPGQTALGNGWICDITPNPPLARSQWWLALPKDLLSGLHLRRRRPGDRFRPAGGRGSRLLQDFFVDRKVARQLRDAWPILVSDVGILWVVGLRADACVATKANDSIWIGLMRECEEE